MEQILRRGANRDKIVNEDSDKKLEETSDRLPKVNVKSSAEDQQVFYVSFHGNNKTLFILLGV